MESKKGYVMLLGFVCGAWRVVGVGVPELADFYAALGYVVQF